VDSLQLLFQKTEEKKVTEGHCVYGKAALKYWTVSKKKLRFQDDSDDLFDLARSGRPHRKDLAVLIHTLSRQFPFSLGSLFCHRLKIGKAACSHMFHNVLHL
jgi:hypothetical protein